MDAIHFVARCWRRVKAETITNCFRCGFKPLTDSTIVDKPSIMENEPALSGVTNGENYLNIDNDLACFQECEELDDDIVEEIVSKRVCIDEFPEDDDVDDNILIQPMITHRVARQCVQTLQRYFLEQGVTDAVNSALDVCAEEVFDNLASKKQTTLEAFTLPNL